MTENELSKIVVNAAYQLTVAQKYNMIVVTFDKDFNFKGIIKCHQNKLLNNKLNLFKYLIQNLEWKFYLPLIL